MGRKGDDPHAAMVERAHGGDARAVGLLLEALGPTILRVCRGVHGPTADAEDAAQEAMIQLLGALPAFRGDSTIVGFATRIAARTAVRARKRERSRHARRDSIDEQVLPQGESGSVPDEQLLAARRVALLRNMMDELPDAQAETLLLRVVLGHSLKEVAEITRAPINTVRSRIRLAREAMLRHIAAEVAKNPEVEAMLEVES